MPNAHAIVVMALMIITFYLYTRPWIRIEIVSLGLLTALLAMFHLAPFTAVGRQITDLEILGVFGHQALIAICCLMILGRGLTLTGALEPAVRLLARLWKITPIGGLLVALIFAATTSAFINDTPVLVLMLPLLIGLAERTGTAASHTLMPVNFAILCGGMLTSIGTSTNILVLSIASDLGLRPFGIFDFTGIAAVALAVAIPYLWLVAPRLLPKRASAGRTSVREYEARLIVGSDSRIVDLSVADLSRAMSRPVQVTRVYRRAVHLTELPDLRFEVGDFVGIIETPERLRELASFSRCALIDPRTLESFVADSGSRIDQHLAEIVIGADSQLSGKTLRDTGFAQDFSVAVVSVYRANDLELRPSMDPATVILQPADVLLVQGREDRIEALGRQPGLLLIDSSLKIPRTSKAPWALAIMGTVILLAATRLLPIHLAALFGVLAMLLTGCVLLQGIGRALSLEVVLLVASSIALGQSLVATGAADWIAAGFAVATRSLPPAAQLATFMAFAAVLTNLVSNSAAAAIGTPIAISMAALLGVPAEPYVLAILFGANLSFATPMAYQTNLMVMSAGGYSFRDFVRVGTPLVLLMVVVLSVLLARRYGL